MRKKYIKKLKKLFIVLSFFPGKLGMFPRNFVNIG
jgi:hypothetical protein